MEDELEPNAFDDFENMSDEELQEAFAAGILKPGLNIPVEEKEYKNNVSGLKTKLKEIKLNLNWIEHLDMINAPAPLPPEVYEEVTKEKSANIPKLKMHWKFNGAFQSKDYVDDFKREMLFHRQAQSAVVEGIQRLKSLGIPTKRPDDYFAEMAKSDQHMHKVRQNLAVKQKAVAQSEKAKELRRLKKLGKKIQIEAKIKQAAEKKKMLNEVKKYRKGLRKDLNFLDNKPDAQQPGKKLNKGNTKAQKKRAIRDEKFGFGGKKKGSKRNTRDSSSFMNSKGKKSFKYGQKSNKRLGKSKRIKQRNRK